jgi:hypothetical protein
MFPKGAAKAPCHAKARDVCAAGLWKKTSALGWRRRVVTATVVAMLTAIAGTSVHRSASDLLLIRGQAGVEVRVASARLANIALRSAWRD